MILIPFLSLSCGVTLDRIFDVPLCRVCHVQMCFCVPSPMHTLVFNMDQSKPSTNFTFSQKYKLLVCL